MVKNNLLRIQVLPGGLVIGHLFPNAIGNGLEYGDVLQIDINAWDIKTVWNVGKADFPMEEAMSMDKFLAVSAGKHLTVGGQ